MGEKLLDSLQEVLKRYDVPFDPDAFTDPAAQAEIQSFVDEYLGPETLLTKEEAALYVFPQSC